jgi:predicted signal transduction protein with EAL and GGDEF domain
MMGEMGETETELQRLTHRLDRERRARIEAETIAERGLRELFVRQQELQLLESIAEAANSASSLTDAMTLALDRICRFTGWPVGRLALVDRPDHGSITIRASGLANPAEPDRMAPLVTLLDRTQPIARAGAPGRVVETGQAFCIQNLRLDPDYVDLAAVAPEEVRGVVAFPVLAGREVVAVLEFLTGPAFTLGEELRALMLQIGTQLGRTVERERARAHLIDAFHDPLTRLPNRALFLRELGRALRRARLSSSYRFAVLFVDLDGFKVVNDSLGHGAGDELLAQIAHRLTESLRRRDTIARAPEGHLDFAGGPTVARIGGDEFTILLDQITSTEDALRVARRVQQNLGAPFDVGGQELYASASIGVAMGDVGHLTPEDLLRDADVAMYRAKSLGKGRCELFDRTMLRKAAARLQLETDIRHALQRNQLRLLFQPIVSLVQSRVIALEALLRWVHPDRGQLSPTDFLAIAEDTGVILSFGEWTITEAVVHLRRWQQSMTGGESLAVAVNLSARQLLEPDLVGVVRRIVHLANVAPGTLRIELTDAQTTSDPSELRQVVDALAELHVPVTLDDFGTGHASVACLSQLPVRAIKLDRSLVGRLETSIRTRTVTRGVVGMAHRLDLEVIAEGVESAGEVEQLLAVGCPLAQGYYFSPPVDAEAVPDTVVGLTGRLAPWGPLPLGVRS